MWICTLCTSTIQDSLIYHEELHYMLPDLPVLHWIYKLQMFKRKVCHSSSAFEIWECVTKPQPSSRYGTRKLQVLVSFTSMLGIFCLKVSIQLLFVTLASFQNPQLFPMLHHGPGITSRTDYSFFSSFPWVTSKVYWQTEVCTCYS